MECKNEACSNEAIGNSSYCSGTCKTIYNRNKKRNNGVTVTATVTASLALPGDPGYAGCCEQVDGQWRVKPGPEPESLQLLTPALLAGLPVGVARPTGQPNERTKSMAGENLNRRLIGVKVWQQTPEYAEVVHRLLSGETEGMNLPTWVVV